MDGDLIRHAIELLEFLRETPFVDEVTLLKDVYKRQGKNSPSMS